MCAWQEEGMCILLLTNCYLLLAGGRDVRRAISLHLPHISRWQEEGMFDALDGLAADMLAAGPARQGRGAEDWRRFVGGKEEL